jgi:enoyl-[acyl-carrier protein] reductase I
MGFLVDKKILITGMLSNRSISYGIAKACAREGAQLAFTYQGEGIEERVRKLAADFGVTDRIYACDVTKDEELDKLADSLKTAWGHVDGAVHSIAFAPKEAIAGDFVDGLSRAAFAQAHDISSYSFAALGKVLMPLMHGRNASLLTLTYFGAERVVPNYNTMGVAKASLEAVVRYLGASLGPRGIRVNAISAGPIKTPAAMGIGGFGKILKFVEQNAPMRRTVTTEDVGNVAAFLLSDLANGITSEITYVDNGFNTVSAGIPTESDAT